MVEKHLRRVRRVLVAMGAGILVLGVTSPASAKVNFSTSTYAVGGFPQSVAVADFNSDGHPDLVVANYGTDDVSFLFGSANGSFTGPMTKGVGDGPWAVAVADFNGDSHPDVAVATTNDDEVWLLTGDAFGAFTAPVPPGYPVGDGPNAMTVGDFNSDGTPDIAVTNLVSNDVSVLLGSPSGGFAASIAFPAGDAPISIAAGDFNGDNDSDLAVANDVSGDVSILFGGPGGTFTGPTTYPVGTYPASVAVGDFNADGHLDLVVAGGEPNDVTVLLGGPGGTFTGPTTYPVGTYPESVAVGDFNADTDPDLAVTTLYSNSVEVLLGGPGATFSAPTVFPVGNLPVSLAAGDFDSDTKTDLAVVNASDDDVSVLLNSSLPSVDLNPDTYEFPPTPVESASAIHDVIVTNTGDALLSLTRFGLEGVNADQFKVVAQTCTGVAVQPGHSCTFGVQYKPTFAGLARAVLVINDNAPDSPQRANLSGTGTPPPAPAFSARPATVDFGNQVLGVTTAPKNMVVHNSGTAPMAITSASVGGANWADFMIATDGCSAQTLAPGASCSMSVAFRPRDFGPRAASLVFADNAAGSPHSIGLKGRGCLVVIGSLCL